MRLAPVNAGQGFAPGSRAIARRSFLTGAGGLLAAPVVALAEAPVDLRDAAVRSDRLFGAAIEPDQVDADPAFADLIRAQCGLLTPENAMKWDALRPSPDVYDFRRADRVVALARAQGAAVHGHCLVWHEAQPRWLAQALADDAPAARRLLTDHIGQVVGRYRGRIRSWDVVNEAVERNDGRTDGLRRSTWLEAIGPSYLPLAFHAARAADPDARLALADYGLEYDDVPWMRDKRATLLQRLRQWRAAGVPIDALSIQGHLIGDRSPAFGQGLRRFLGEIAALGLEIYVSELDVDDQRMAGPPSRRDRASAVIYRRFLDAVLVEPAVRSVSTWGLSDRYTSRAELFPRADGQPVRPLPFDRRLAPKAAAFAIADAFASSG